MIISIQQLTLECKNFVKHFRESQVLPPVLGPHPTIEPWLPHSQEQLAWLQLQHSILKPPALPTLSHRTSKSDPETGKPERVGCQIN